MAEPSKATEPISNADKIELAKMYYAEWEYRNTSLWKDLYKWGLLDLILTFLPYLSGSLVKLEGTPLQSLPWYLFPFLGMVMGVIIPFCAVSSQRRVAAARRAYRESVREIIGAADQYRNKPGLRNVSIAVIVFMSGALFITSLAVFIATLMA